MRMFDYSDREIIPERCCANTEFYRQLFGWSRCSNDLVTLNESEPVSGHVGVGQVGGSDRSLARMIVAAQKEILRKDNMIFSPAPDKALADVLLVSYMLDSSLCVAEVKKRDGFEIQLLTKSAGVVHSLLPNMIERKRKKGLEQFRDQFWTCYKELNSKKFSVVRVKSEVDGFDPDKSVFNLKSAGLVLPYFVVNNYAALKVRQLSSGIVKLTFLVDGVVHRMITTLDPNVVAKWMGVTVPEARSAIVADWLSPVSFGYLSLPDLSKQGEFRSIPLLKIISVVPYK